MTTQSLYDQLTPTEQAKLRTALTDEEIVRHLIIDVATLPLIVGAGTSERRLLSMCCGKIRDDLEMLVIRYERKGSN